MTKFLTLRNLDSKPKAKKSTKINTVRTQKNDADKDKDDENEDNNYCIVCF